MSESFNTTTDLQGLSRRQVSPNKAEPAYHYDARPVPGRPGLYYWELTVYDARGGLNKQVGDFNQDFDRSSESTIDTRFPRTGILPPLLTEATSPDPGGTQTGIHFEQIFGTTIIATGATNDLCLFKETSATNPAIAAIAGSSTAGRPGASFTCAHAAVINSTEMLVLGRVGAVPIATTDTSGTLYGTAAHTDLSPLWGLVHTFIGSNLFYADDGIYSLSETVNWSSAPTPTVSMKSGGFALGALLLGGGLGTVRAYWAEPDVALSTGILAYGSEKPFHIVSTDLEGYDKVPFEFRPDLTRLYWAAAIGNGFVATDLERLVWKDGAYTIDQEIFRDLPPNSDKQYRCRGGWVIGDTLKIRVERRAAPNGTGSTQWSIWESQINSLQWHQISAWKTYSSTGSFGVMPSGSLPWGVETHHLHHQADGSWWRQEWAPSNVNTFSLRKTTGAQSSTGFAYESSGTWTAPAWELPGLEGKTKVWGGFVFMGDLEAGGTGGTPAYVTVSAHGQSRPVNVNTADAQIPEIVKINPPPSFDKFKPSITATQQSGGTDPTRYTPNIFPTMFWGYAYDDIEAFRDIPDERPRLGRR